MRSILVASLVGMLAAGCSTTTDSPESTSPNSPAPAAPTPDPATQSPPAAGTPAPTPGADPPATGAIYTLSNDLAGNEVVAYERQADGSLTNGVRIATGGVGTGAGLGSQGALALSADGTILVGVNAASNDVSSFQILNGAPVLRSRLSSGGTTPVSVAMRGKLAYVLNAGSDDISGFTIGADGALTAIAGSRRALNTTAVGAAEIAFSAKGDAIIVSEKATNMLETFTVDAAGALSQGEAHPAAGMTPFGFTVTSQGFILVTEAAGAAAGASAVSSYALDAAGHPGAAAGAEIGIQTLSPSVVNHQTAACWMAATADGKFAFSANTPNGNLSGYRVGDDGKITLMGGAWGVTGDGSKPGEMAMDKASKHLYVLAGGTHDIRRFDVNADGSLLAIAAGSVPVPTGAVGLVGL